MIDEQGKELTHRNRELEIRIGCEPQDQPRAALHARVTDPYGRSSDVRFVSPVSRRELDAVIERIPASSKALQRSVPDQSLDPVGEIGTRLFQALFSGTIGRMLAGEMLSASDPMRIRLLVEDPEAAELPW